MKYLLLFLMLFSSCRTVKKDISKLSETLAEKNTEQVTETVKENAAVKSVSELKKASESFEIAELKIYPKGVFVIDLSGTFTGEADSVVQVKNKAVSDIYNQSNVITQVKELEATKDIKNDSERIESKEILDKKVERKPNTVLGIFLVVIALGVGWFFYWKNK
jgi:DNA-directed RNA polymerase specialized sigma54-like protein